MIFGCKFNFCIYNRILFDFFNQAAELRVRVEIDNQVGDIRFADNNARGNVHAVDLLWCVQIINRILFIELLALVPNQVAKHQAVVKIVPIYDGVRIAEVGFIAKVEKD